MLDLLALQLTSIKIVHAVLAARISVLAVRGYLASHFSEHPCETEMPCGVGPTASSDPPNPLPKPTPIQAGARPYSRPSPLNSKP